MRTLVLLPVILGWHLVLQTGAPALPSGDQWLTTPVDDRTFNTYLDFFNYDRTLPFDVKTAKVDEAQGLRRERLSFQSTSGVRVTAILFQAPATTGTRKSGMVLLHGGGPQGKDAAFMLRFGELISRAGWSVLSIDLQYFGERSTQLLSTFSEQEKHVKLYNQPAVYLAWVTQTVKDVSRAVDFLAEQRGVDPRRTGVFGLSRGAHARVNRRRGRSADFAGRAFLRRPLRRARNRSSAGCLSRELHHQDRAAAAPDDQRDPGLRHDQSAGGRSAFQAGQAAEADHLD